MGLIVSPETGINRIVCILYALKKGCENHNISIYGYTNCFPSLLHQPRKNIYLFIYLFVCLFVCLFVYLFILWIRFSCPGKKDGYNIVSSFIINK